MREDEIKRIIAPLLHGRLDSFGLKRFSLKPAEDHSGEPALFIDAYFVGGGHPVDADALSRAAIEIRMALEKAGEERFPYLRHHIPDAKDEAAA